MKKQVIDFAIIITSVISILNCIFPAAAVESGYELIWLHPLAFATVYLLIFRSIIRTNRFKITVYSIVTLAWLRCVVIPLCSAISGVYNGVSYIYVTQGSAQLAILLVAFELIISSAFLYIIVNLKHNQKFIKNSLDAPLELRGSKTIYVLFIFFALGLYVVIGRKLNLLEFFVISTGSAERFGDIELTSLVLLRQIFKCGMIFLFVLITSYCKKMHEKTGKILYVYYAIAIAVFNVGVIVGERRSEQVYTCLVVIFILINTFKQHRKKIIIIITAAAGIVLLIMSVYKQFAVFYYGTYTGALQASNINLEWLTKTLQSYFFGTQNVATAIELKNISDLSLLNMLYDFGRSTFGISFLLKNLMPMTTEYFNTFIYFINKANGHVISGVGYGYIYFGAIFSPTIVCLNMFISIKLEKWFNNTSSYEMKYVIGYMLVRFVTNIYVNTPPLISLSTNMLFTAGLIYFVARVLRSKTNLAAISGKVEIQNI